LIGGGEHQEEESARFAVEGLEIDAVGGDPHGEVEG
jgi:hypothetical protein